MRFEDFDREMRVFEESLDQCIPSDMYIVARLDGRSFTRLTKDICQFRTPFDIRFRDLMIRTVKALMTAGFRIVYGYTESDEISLLFHPDDRSFGRKVRKIDSILAGKASAAFSLALGRIATFDCRVIPLPDLERVVDYFLWRQEDSRRNSLYAHCYWALRREGASAGDATSTLEGMSVTDKNELLISRGIDYSELPNWQQRGVGVAYMEIRKEGFDPVGQEKAFAVRRKLTEVLDLPAGDAYRRFVLKVLARAAENA